MSHQKTCGSRLQFLRELHFIEAVHMLRGSMQKPTLQFLRELHFIEARTSAGRGSSWTRCSSFWNCTSLRQERGRQHGTRNQVAVPSGAALH